MTVTSVENAGLATPLVSALNRISAYATVPIVVSDDRKGRKEFYPTDHITTLVDEDARKHLLEGSHSLWYEYVKLLLHDALTDLDRAMLSVPSPVQTAVRAELNAEAASLIDPSEDPEPSAPEDIRKCESENPFVTFDSSRGNIYLGDPYCLGAEHSRFDHLEGKVYGRGLKRAVDDLRILYGAYRRAGHPGVNFVIDWSLFVDYEPLDDPERHFLNIFTPMPGDDDTDEWRLDVGRWVLDDPDNEDGPATGEPLLRCVRAIPPSMSELAEVLERSCRKPEQLAEWAATPVGETLEGTTFVVTNRGNEPR
ncbi:hypothetical protein [Herbidospora sp. NBRC 101105]|uniref:hypothetical protein n=1 Tax=Herbidospora sp. NBRC 101105 TaxID=3032195 RepID=UPI002552ACD3|nr:hypothetical protein [Herbidospora sp. NBRC 101105]